MHVSVHLPCCVYAGCSLELQCFEIKTEADSSDITEYPRDDMSSTGMTDFITLHAKLNSTVYCYRSCLWGRAGSVCLWVCYHDNSKLRASIFTKLGL